jgi:hypothetical protein
LCDLHPRPEGRGFTSQEDKISYYFNKHYDSAEQKKDTIKQIAEYFAVLAMHQILITLYNSPLLKKGKSFCKKIAKSFSNSIENYICKLNPIDTNAKNEEINIKDKTHTSTEFIAFDIGLEIITSIFDCFL